jgi:hypothetical protein
MRKNLIWLRPEASRNCMMLLVIFYVVIYGDWFATCDLVWKEWAYLFNEILHICFNQSLVNYIACRDETLNRNLPSFQDSHQRWKTYFESDYFTVGQNSSLPKWLWGHLPLRSKSSPEIVPSLGSHYSKVVICVEKNARSYSGIVYGLPYSKAVICGDKNPWISLIPKPFQIVSVEKR